MLSVGDFNLLRIQNDDFFAGRNLQTVLNGFGVSIDANCIWFVSFWCSDVKGVAGFFPADFEIRSFGGEFPTPNFSPCHKERPDLQEIICRCSNGVGPG